MASGHRSTGFKFHPNKSHQRLQDSGNDTLLERWIMPIESFFMDESTLTDLISRFSSSWLTRACL